MRKEAYYYLGIDFKKAGFFDRASKIFDSFRKEKNRINALEQLEGIYVELNEWDNAIEIRNKLLEEYNGDKEKLDESRAILAHFYTEKANEEINKGDINNGKTFIEKAISLNPTLVYTIFSYSSILLKENKLFTIDKNSYEIGPMKLIFYPYTGIAAFKGTDQPVLTFYVYGTTPIMVRGSYQPQWDVEANLSVLKGDKTVLKFKPIKMKITPIL